MNTTSATDREEITSAKRKLPLHNIVAPVIIILLTALGWYLVIDQTRNITQDTIAAYQQTELELGRTIARNVENFVRFQVEMNALADISENELQIFEQFVTPVGPEQRSVWLSTPNRVLFHSGSNSPNDYQSNNIAEIFDLQAQHGASHYQDMTEAVMNGHEGVGWYVWRPDQGKEIAAWTPISVGEYTWIVGLATPLPDILESTGATNHIRTSVTVMILSSIVALGLLLTWTHRPTWPGVAKKALRESEIIPFSSVRLTEPAVLDAAADATKFKQAETEKERLLSAEQEQRELTEALHDIAAIALNSTRNFDDLLERILTNIERVVPHDTADIMLIESDHIRVVSSRSFNEQDHQPAPDRYLSPADFPSLQHMAQTRRPLIIPDTRTNSDWTDLSETRRVYSYAGVPIRLRDKIMGFLNLTSTTPNFFTPAHGPRLQAFADQAAIAIENTRLFEAEHAARQQAENLREEARQNLAEITRLYELSTEFVSALSVEDVANLVIEKVVHATAAHSAVLNLLDEQGNFERAFGPAEPRPRVNGTTMSICQTGQPLVIYDSQQEPRGIPPHLIQSGIRASIGLPLKAGKQSIGVLFVRHSQPHYFSRREVETLFIFANQAAIAIQNARLYEQVQQYTAELEELIADRTFEIQALYELAQALGRATQLTEVVRLVLLHLYHAIPFDVAACLLVNDSTGNMVIQSQHTYYPHFEQHLLEIMGSTLEKICGRKVNFKAVEVHHIHPREKTSDQPPLESLGSLIQVPIFVDETLVGLLLIGAKQAGQFEAEHARFLHTAADQAGGSIRRLQSLLAAEHRRLENLVAHLPIGVILLDTELYIILANPMGQEFLAMLNETTVGDKLSRLGDHPVETMLSLDSTGTPFEIAVTGPPSHLFEVTAKPIAGASDAGSWLLVIRDITEERNTQKQIRQQEKIAAVGQLAAGIAHDFNNILTSIIGYADILQREPDLSKLARQDLQRIDKQGRRAAHLVRQILDFSRQSITEKQPLDLAPLTKETIKLLERTIPENIQISLEIEPTNQLYTVNADLTQMQQVLTNLAVNARDAMPAGGSLQFRLSLLHLLPNDSPPCPDMAPGYWIAISISDTGAGIPPENRSRIFEPFFTTKAAGKGTGLGLAQVYGIITEHDGHINLISEETKGSTFTLYLPRLSVLPEEVGLRSVAGETPQGHGEVILVVEDNTSVLETSRAMLEHLGYQVLTAVNGQQALEIYEQHQAEIGLVLTDITMPDMGGIALSQALHQQNAAIKVVALTGYPLDTNREAKTWLAAGIVDWLQKPVSLDRLAVTVSRWLNQATSSGKR